MCKRRKLLPYGVLSGRHTEAGQLLASIPEEFIAYHVGALAAADRPLVQALLAATDRMNHSLGGLYSGILDGVRSTLCDPAFGYQLRV